MAAEMVFKLGANVGEAVQGMNLVQQRVQFLENSIKYFQEKLANTQSQKFYAFALDQIAKKKQELAQITRATGVALDKSNDSTRRATLAMTDLGRVVQDAPFGFIAISNNINPLVESFGRLKAQTGSTGGAFKALVGSLAGPAGIGLAVSVGTSLLVAFGDQIFGTGKKAEKTAEQTDKLKNSIDGIYSGVAKEAANVGSLIAILQSETETRQRKLSAIKELQQIQPEVFKNLKLEGSEVVGLNGAYASYIANLKNVVAAKIKQAQLEQTLEKLLKAQGVTATGLELNLINAGKQLEENRKKQLSNGDDLYGVNRKIAADRKKQNDQEKAEINSLQKEVERLTKDLSELSQTTKIPEIKAPKIKKPKIEKTDAIINEAKQLSNELQKVFDGQILLPRFSETQTKAQQLTIAKKIIGDFKANKIELKIPLVVDDEKIDVPPLLGDQGVLTEAQRNAQRDGAILGLSFNEGVKKALETGAEVRPENLAFRQFSDAFEETQQRIQNISNKIADSLSSLKTEAITQFAESLGQAFATGDLKGVFKGFVDTIAGGVVSIGKQMVALGLKAVVLKNALKSLFANPAALVAAGVGLIAVGSAIKGALGKGLEGREKGGPVTGNTPYIVGERGPELFVPAVGGSIIPNNRLTSFNGRPAFASSMGGRSIVRGNDILLASARTQRSQNRVNA